MRSTGICTECGAVLGDSTERHFCHASDGMANSEPEKPVELTPLGATLAEMQDSLNELRERVEQLERGPFLSDGDRSFFIRATAIRIFARDREHRAPSAWQLAKELWANKPEDC